MDLEFTFWQMLYLCLNPSIVYAFPTRKLTCTACLASRLVSFLPFFPNLRRYRHTTYHKRALCSHASAEADRRGDPNV